VSPFFRANAFARRIDKYLPASTLALSCGRLGSRFYLSCSCLHSDNFCIIQYKYILDDSRPLYAAAFDMPIKKEGIFQQCASVIMLAL